MVIVRLCHEVASKTNHLASLCALLDVNYELLLLLLEFCAFTIQLALSLGKGALVLSQPLCRGDGATKEGLLNRLWFVSAW